MENTTVVAQISNKTVTTKFGPKPTFSFKGEDGEWYSLGFKKPRFTVGSEVSFEYEESTYGKQVDDATVKVVGGSPATSKGVSTMAPATEKPAYTGHKRVFPVPPLDGDRAIIRQNALTNAREMFAAAHAGASFDYSETEANLIIGMARMFEAYTTGDIDTEMAKEIVAKKEKAAKLKEAA